jgi:membrane protein YqaA with SNARE-associated domain
MARFFIHLGALGLFLLGIADGVLFAPFGIDVLLIVMVVRHPGMLILYVLCAAAGSAAGYSIVDAISRKGGEEGLRKKLGERKFEKIRRKMEKRGTVAVALAALMPPPFPFTPVLAAASAFQNPRKTLLPVLFAARTVRYLIVALLAHHYGRRLIRIIESPGFRWFVIGLAVVSIAGSAVVIIRWQRSGRGRGTEPEMAPASD